MKNQDLPEQNQDFLDLVDYIKENKADYGLEKLRSGLLKQGVSYTDIKKALEFIEGEEDRKIAGFLEEVDDGEEKKDVILGEDFSGNKRVFFQKKADKLIGTISDSVLGRKNPKKLFIDILKYGAISFLFFSIIVYFFKYLGASYVYPRTAANMGVFGNIALPDVFLYHFTFWALLLKLAWSLVLGGVLTIVFLKWLAKVWPFSNWFKLQQKLFAFYAIYEFIISIFIYGLISSFSLVYLVGYLIILIGIALGAYLASNYLAIVLENKYEDQIRQFTR